MTTAKMIVVCSACFFLSSCIPQGNAQLEKPDLPDAIQAYLLLPSKNKNKIADKHVFTITNYNVFDSKNLKEHSHRYVLPEYSVSGFFNQSDKYGGSHYRPLMVNNNSITLSPLERSDEIKKTVHFEIIDLSGEKIEIAQGGLLKKSHFPKGAKCYSAVEMENHQDYIQYDLSDQINPKLDKDGLVQGLTHLQFGRYSYFPIEGEEVKSDNPTAIIVAIPPRFYKATFYPKRTFSLKGDVRLPSSPFVGKPCHVFNEIAAQIID